MYRIMNLYRGRMCEQGDVNHKATALRECKDMYERTIEHHERLNTPEGDRSELFIVVNVETGEIVGGSMKVED